MKNLSKYALALAAVALAMVPEVAHAAFVPAQQRIATEREYRFGRNIFLGEGAEFRLFLTAVYEGKVYYDPGIKLEDASSDRPRAKKRSQFRVKSSDLPALYVQSQTVDSCEVAGPTV